MLILCIVAFFIMHCYLSMSLLGLKLHVFCYSLTVARQSADPRATNREKVTEKKKKFQRAVCLSHRVTESDSFCPFDPIVSIETS